MEYCCGRTYLEISAGWGPVFCASVAMEYFSFARLMTWTSDSLEPVANKWRDDGRGLNCRLVMPPRFFSIRVTRASSALPAAMTAGSQMSTIPLVMPPATRPMGRDPLWADTVPQSRAPKRALEQHQQRAHMSASTLAAAATVLAAVGTLQRQRQCSHAHQHERTVS